MAEKINATRLLEDVRTAAQEADAVLESDSATQISYAEKLAELLDCVTLFDHWMTDSLAVDLPEQWVNPPDVSVVEESPF